MRVRSARPFEEFTIRPKLWIINLEGKTQAHSTFLLLLKEGNMQAFSFVCIFMQINEKM